MLALYGRVAGISGITNGIFNSKSYERAWRIAFVLGLITGGVCLYLWNAELLVNHSRRSFAQLVVSGLLVGFGTVLGGGCTSGHGVCGVGRLSPRSLTATMVFILFGMLTATLLNLMVGR